MVAIVWKDKPQTEEIARPIFDENNMEFIELKEKEAASYKKTFRQANQWYKGPDLDMLSGEEATTIAESTVKFALENNLITKDEAGKIRADVEAYFKGEAVIGWKKR